MKRTLESIQHLRGIAALGVVCFHASTAAGFPQNAGAAGVDIFFVISGFIMWSVSAREASPGLFVWRRIIRIVPLYWLATLIMVGLNHPGVGEIVRSLFFVPYADSAGKIHPVLNPGWTLNYEMFFYAIFALVLLLPRRSQLLALGCALVALAWTGYVLHPAGAILAVYTNNILLEFLAGAVLCRVWQAGRLNNAALGWAGMIGGIAIFVIEQKMGIYSDRWRFIVWGIPALMVVAGGLSVEGAGKFKPVPLLGRIGDSSYSLYLFHGLVVSFLAKLLGGPALFVAAMIAGPLVGYVAWRALEVPITGFLRKLRLPGAPVRRPA